jgi:hypothetical protein
MNAKEFLVLAETFSAFQSVMKGELAKEVAATQTAIKALAK